MRVLYVAIPKPLSHDLAWRLYERDRLATYMKVAAEMQAAMVDLTRALTSAFATMQASIARMMLPMAMLGEQLRESVPPVRVDWTDA